MKRIFSILFALALVLSFSLIAATPVAAVGPVVNIDTGEDFSTIQAAIDDSDTLPGHTIEVSDGTYDEIVVIDKANLIVQAGSTPLIQPTSAAVWPNMGAVNIMADGVTLDGFEVDGSLMPGNHEVINAYGVSDVTIKNNIAHGATSGTWDGMGIAAWDWDGTKTVDRVTIENNEVYDTGRMGIFCMDFGGSGYDLTEGHIIRGNTVHDTWLKCDDWGDYGGGIQINVGKDCTITDNTIYNIASGSTYAAYYNPCIYMFGSGTGNNITCNTMRDSDAGITLWISGEGGTSIDWEGDSATSPQVHRNNIYNNTNYGAYSINPVGTPMVMDAENNWWGDDSGPGGAGPGSGDAVSINVDYDPWVDNSVTTATLTGTASFATSEGNIVGLTAVLPPAPPPVTLPHGMFDFTICCLTGPTATLSITFPDPIPVGYKWWKYVGGSWYSLPIGSDDGDNFITVTLQDNVIPDDEDTVPGQITDQGGPGPGPGAVGWETYPVSKVRVLLPWIGLFAVIMAVASLFLLRRRRAQS